MTAKQGKRVFASLCASTLRSLVLKPSEAAASCRVSTEKAVAVDEAPSLRQMAGDARNKRCAMPKADHYWKDVESFAP